MFSSHQQSNLSEKNIKVLLLETKQQISPVGANIG
jgi:hypothetical protein